MTWDNGLSSEQRRAAGHWGASARILAGPGTGKTRTLIQHVAYLLRARNVPPEQIVVLTFTRAATRELRERLTRYLGFLEADLPLVCTLHAFALRILLRYQFHSGIIQPLRVADDYEERYVIFPELGQMLGQSPSNVEKALKAFEATWNTLDQEHQAWQTVEYRREFEISLRTLSQFYEFTLRSELVYRLLAFLDGNPVIGQSLGIKHLLVDEYQDLNYCDQEVIARLEELGAELYVVGDDDQSVYEFRHAYPDGIRQFPSNRPNCADYQLTICYRCPTTIVNLARSLISWELGRTAKSLQSGTATASGDVQVLQFGSNDEEAEGIAAICKAYIDSGSLQPQDITILLSRRSLAKRIVDEFEKKGLTATVLMNIWPLGGRDEDGREGRRAYCVLRLLVDQNDALALRTWLGLQKGIGPQIIKSVRDFCRSYGFTLWQGLSILSGAPTQIKYGHKVKTYFDKLTTILGELKPTDNLTYVLDYVLVSAGKGEVRRFLDRVIEEEGIENLNDLVVSLQTYDLTAETLLEAHAIRIMTMHKAKGLSSELVIIPALEQHLIPGRFDENAARRLLYVSMTRSRRSLVMTHALYRTGAESYLGSGAGQNQQQRSRFLYEMGVQSQSGPGFINTLSQRLFSQVSVKCEDVNTAILRELLKEAFSDEALISFCYDHFREVYHQFGTGMSKTVKIQWLIEFSISRMEITPLLRRVEEFNPAQYARFADSLFS